MAEKDILRSCPLFSGLSEAELKEALSFFAARRTSYRKGDSVIRVGSQLQSFGLVLKGNVQILQDDQEGHRMISALASTGDTFGESLCFLQVDEAPIYACALSSTQVMWLNCDRLRIAGENPLENQLRNRFTAMLAARTLSMNSRIQVLCKHSLREKLLTLFSQYMQKSGARQFEIPFNRTDLALYLGVHRSALTRELSRMREENLIQFEGNRFTLPQKSRNTD